MIVGLINNTVAFAVSWAIVERKIRLCETIHRKKLLIDQSNIVKICRFVDFTHRPKGKLNFLNGKRNILQTSLKYKTIITQIKVQHSHNFNEFFLNGKNINAKIFVWHTLCPAKKRPCPCLRDYFYTAQQKKAACATSVKLG